ncbi:MAG: hypothetical protein KOO62_11140 [candidate division Zixibacteria bacterium]|nr:hypothetical protein [candidate division Zixibacteria bacterium]
MNCEDRSTATKFSQQRGKWVCALLIVSFLTAAQATAQRAEIDKDYFQDLSTASLLCIGTHNIGKLVFGITNFGMVGIGENRGVTLDCFSGTRVRYGEYPKGSGNSCFYKGGLWIGAVVDGDTLVSTGAEGNNQSREFLAVSPMIRRSTLDPLADEFSDAISELDYIGVYADTFSAISTFDPIERRLHTPLGVQVTQRSLSWSYAHTDDWVIIEYTIENVGNNFLQDLYVGVYWDVDVHKGGIDLNRSRDPYGRKSNPGGSEDLGGYIQTSEYEYKSCVYRDTVNIAWTADNDGDYKGGDFTVPNVAALRVLGMAGTEHTVSFNWWSFNYSSSYDFGPQTKEGFRQMGNGIGTPIGDRNKYAMMSNGHIDYDPVYALAIQAVDQVWAKPSSKVAQRITRGLDFQYVLSVGPFDMLPGSEIVVPVAFVAGENLHRERYNLYFNMLRNYQPDEFRSGLDFTSLKANADVAARVYDIPGVDTDGDGYSGAFHVCDIVDTFYYKGDGAPDLVAAAPPPSPDLRLYPIRNGIRLRFNGLRSENTPDLFSGEIDFEGYRVYIGRDDREESFSLIASFDHHNYDKHTFTHQHRLQNYFQVMDTPFTLEKLRCLYGFAADSCMDSAFSPLNYTYHHPYIHPLFPEDSIFYFTKHGYNQSNLNASAPIHKIFPDQPPPGSLEHFEPDELTDDGYPKYYEYGCTIENLLPNVPYYVSVTSFDVGSVITGLASLESSILIGAKYAYPEDAWDHLDDEVGNVYVFPNPYRQDAYYRVYGLEGLGMEDRSRDRVRRITFANLPPRCTISIYSLDGDLIRKMDHDIDPSDPISPYHEWDLVSRNTQLVVSGLYYWIVENEDGQTQIGKLAILL